MLGFRLHDMIYGGDVAKEVTDGYLRAWSEFGVVDPNGHYNIVVQQCEHSLVSRPPLPWADFLLGDSTWLHLNGYKEIDARNRAEGASATLRLSKAIPSSTTNP